MFPSSVRRVVSGAPQSINITSLPSSCSRVATTYSFAYKFKNHQRRYSSSKPSSPDNGPKDLSSRPSVPASSNTKSSDDKDEKGDKSGRRGRKSKDAPLIRQLPSVPSTQNIKGEGLALSTFFALYRPISITQHLPRTISEELFAQMFSPTPKYRKITDALTTLAQQVQDLELQMKGNTPQGDDDGIAAGEASPMVNVRHPDGSETSVYIQLDGMSGSFIPYTPPPLPRVQNESSSDTEASAREEDFADGCAEEAHPTRVYKATVTIEETVDADGQYKVFAHSPQIVEEGVGEAPSTPRTFLERLAERQLRLDDAHRQRFGDETIEALSVRRQKKRKIKKKKYKKLMRRTRNERRKLDKL